MISATSYGQGSSKEVSSLNNSVTVEDALTLTLDKLDAADTYIEKLETENKLKDERLALKDERLKLMQDRLDTKDAQLAANEKERQASGKIEAKKDEQIAVLQKRNQELEKKKGGFVKGFGVGLVTGFFAEKLVKFLIP